jgi:uroporphyrinogen-III synthase
MSGKKLFISKNPEETTELQSFCERHGFDIVSCSLIDFVPVPFEILADYEVVFFNSIRAARYFLASSTLNENTKVACLGVTTKKKLEAIGIAVDFYRENGGEPAKIADQFKDWLNGRKVLIPRAFDSLKTIVNALPKEQCQEVVVYKTIASCKKIDPCGIYIFTSPSNVNSFLSCNSVPEGEVVAWGNSTADYLIEKGINVSHKLTSAGQEELIQYLKQGLVFNK